MKRVPTESQEEPVRILLVDDKPDKLMALESLVQDLGPAVDKARSGTEALRYLLQQDYALILLDVRMPVMDGFETAALIRQRPRCEHTPIIFVTAHTATETHVTRGYSLGAVDYIFAPIVPEVLRAKVAVFVDLYRKGQQIKQQAELLQQAAERRAKALESRLDSLLDRLDVGVFRATPEGKLLEANPALLALLGVSGFESAAAVDVKPLQGQPSEWPPSGERWERDVRLERDGAVIWLSVSCVLTTSDDGTPCVEGLVDDITERKRAEEALALKAEQLVRSNSDLEQFAYVASHDLQEPLRTIHAYTSLLVQSYGDRLDDRAKMYLQFAADGAARMQGLVRDLLSFSRLRATERQFEATDLREVIDRALFNLQTAIRESEAQVEIAEELPVVDGDEVMLVQLFQNLVGNAIKFRGQEPPRVRIAAEPHDGTWSLVVQDNGIGIPQKHHDRIFSMFRRLHAPGRFDGSGMGLAICRHIVERHGGRIWVESEEGSGATFRFTVGAGGG